MRELRISLLHVAPKPGELSANYELVERAIRVASSSGANLVVAPELCVSGYQFIEVIGTEWIASSPDEWTERFCHLARSLNLALLFGHAERGEARKLYDCSVLVDEKGIIIGHHRKVNTHAEPWASPGEEKKPVNWNGISLGMLICSDAYSEDVAQTLRSKGAQLLVSPANWAPGFYGPEGEWEQRTLDTGLPLIVCNRTGEEKTLNFCDGESVAVKQGQRILSHSSRRSAVLSFSWDLDLMVPASKEFEVAYL